MKRADVLLLAAVGVALVMFTMRPDRPRCSGFSFAHLDGGCVVWYARATTTMSKMRDQRLFVHRIITRRTSAGTPS